MYPLKPQEEGSEEKKEENSHFMVFHTKGN